MLTVMMCVLKGILQALEYLLERGYAPRRSFYIGLGHDEEVRLNANHSLSAKIPAESLLIQLLIWFSQISGSQGAVNIVKLLKSRGVKLLYVFR